MVIDQLIFSYLTKETSQYESEIWLMVKYRKGAYQGPSYPGCPAVIPQLAVTITRFIFRFEERKCR